MKKKTTPLPVPLDATSARERFRRRFRKERELWIISAFILVWLVVICYSR